MPSTVRRGSPIDKRELPNVHQSLDNQDGGGNFASAKAKSAQKGKEKVDTDPRMIAYVQRGICQENIGWWSLIHSITG